MQAFYALAAGYLMVGLAIAWRHEVLVARPGWRAQLGALCAVLGCGLLWPEHLRAQLEPFDD